MTQPWYPFYWSDYSGKTMHLSMSQHGAYMLFLRWVYTTEKPIPDKQRYSIARAMNEQERSDADFVLSEFFVLHGNNWHSNRAESVIHETKNRHEKRVNAGKKGGLAKSSNAKEMLEQKCSNALVTTTTTTIDISKDISIEGGELKIIQENDNGPIKKTKHSKGTKLNEWLETHGQSNGNVPSDWFEWSQRKYGWDHETIGHIVERFWRYFTGPDAKEPRKKDWKRAFQTWCDRDLGTAQAFIRSRAGSGGGKGQGYTSSIHRSTEQALGLFVSGHGASSDDVPEFDRKESNT